MPDFIEIDPPENTRTYYFEPSCSCDELAELTIAGVKAISVSSSGNHRLNCVDGSKWIVSPNWLAIQLDIEDWSL